MFVAFVVFVTAIVIRVDDLFLQEQSPKTPTIPSIDVKKLQYQVVTIDGNKFIATINHFHDIELVGPINCVPLGETTQVKGMK